VTRRRSAWPAPGRLEATAQGLGSTPSQRLHLGSRGALGLGSFGSACFGPVGARNDFGGACWLNRASRGRYRTLTADRYPRRPLLFDFDRPLLPSRRTGYGSAEGNPASVLKSGERGSNPRPQAWEACALPTELSPRDRDSMARWQRADGRATQAPATAERLRSPGAQ
jgi:hypothetical protein